MRPRGARQGIRRRCLAGTTLLALLAALALSPAASAAPQFLGEWGSTGAGDGQFDLPSGLDIDAAGNVYVADFDNHRIQKLTRSGGFLAEWEKSGGGSGSGDGEFNGPNDVAVASDGTFYVADLVNHRIQKFDAAGNFAAKWGKSGGGSGSAGGEFNQPGGIDIDNFGNVWVADTGNDRIQSFLPNGTHSLSRGSAGTGNGQFADPFGIATADRVFVADATNHRIQRFALNGTFSAKWGSLGNGDDNLNLPKALEIGPNGNVYVADTLNDRIQVFDASGTFREGWGSSGTGDGQFDSPGGIATDAGGNVFVADTVNDRVQVFGEPIETALDSAPSGTIATNEVTLSSSASPAANLDHFECKLDGGSWTACAAAQSFSGLRNGPHTIAVRAVDFLGNADSTPEEASFTVQFATPGPAGFGFLGKWARFDGKSGIGDGEFASPAGVATDAAGNVYVADLDNHRIQKFDAAGNFAAKWGKSGGGSGSADGEFKGPAGVATDAAGNVWVADTGNDRIQKFDSDGNFIRKWGNFGSGDSDFSVPFGVATDAAGSVYVADLSNNRIQKFDSDGNFIRKWGAFGDGDGEFKHPSAVASDAAGNVYVADSTNSRIQKFDSDGNFIRKWGLLGDGDGEFKGPVGVATDAAGNVYVTEFNGHRVQKFDAAGTFLGKWGSLGGGNGNFNDPRGIATDAAGNVYVADQANDRIQKFGDPRQTTTDSGPQGTIATDQASFAFSGAPVGDLAFLQCKLDGGAWEVCASPHTYSGLADGPHTARFRSVDGFGNADPTPAEASFTVDTSDPAGPKACSAELSALEKAKKKLKKAKKKVKKAKKKVKKAKKKLRKAKQKGGKGSSRDAAAAAGKSKKLKKLKKKLKKVKKKRKKAKKKRKRAKRALEECRG